MNTISKLIKIQRGIIPQNCRWSNGSYSLHLHLILLHACSKTMKVSLKVQSFRTDTIFILNSEKMVELWFLFSAYYPMKLYICSKFHENIDDRFKVIEWIRF